MPVSQCCQSAQPEINSQKASNREKMTIEPVGSRFKESLNRRLNDNVTTPFAYYLQQKPINSPFQKRKRSTGEKPHIDNPQGHDNNGHKHRQGNPVHHQLGVVF